MTAENRRAQVEIDAEYHAFLKHDSWVDCTEWYDGGFDTDSLETHVERNEDAIKGVASSQLCEAILNVVRESRLLSPIEKEQIAEEVSSVHGSG